MRSEDSSVHMGFVDDYIFKVLPEFLLPFVMGSKTMVKLVRVCHYEPRPEPYGTPLRLGRISIIYSWVDLYFQSLLQGKD